MIKDLLFVFVVVAMLLIVRNWRLVCELYIQQSLRDRFSKDTDLRLEHANQNDDKSGFIKTKTRNIH